MVTEKDSVVPDPMVVPKPMARSFTIAYKQRIVAEYESLDKQGKSQLMRREGLYPSLVGKWREKINDGVSVAFQASAGRPALDPRDKKIAELERKLDKALVEIGKMRTVIEVQGKLSALLDQFATNDASTLGD